MTRPNGETRPSAAARSAAARAADHEAIGGLVDELLPSLIAKLGATGLGEIEVREGDWHVRLRGHRGAAKPRPADKAGGDRAGRAQPGHEGHGHAPGAIESRREGRPTAPARAGHDHDDHEDRDASAHRAVATSPAVGVFQPRQGVSAGTKVRQGDRVASVEMLGIPQEVLAPADGIVGATLAEPGQAVEFGQELLVIELATAGAPTGATAPSGAGA